MSKESLASEGDKLFEKGDSYTKRTFTRWSPDWGEASVHFEKAATKYRAAGQTYQARLARALIRAAEAYENLNSLNSSAKCLTQALKILVTLNDEELRTEAAQLCKKAANLYQANGQPDKAAQTLVQGAGFFGKQDAKVALKYYMEALTIYAEESREALAHDTYKKGIAYAVKFQEFDMAITLLENQAKIYQKQGSGNLYVNYLGIIVIYCYLKQCEKARTALNSFDNKDSGEAADKLLLSLEQGDEAKLEEAKKHPCLKYIDVSISRLVKGIQLDPNAVPLDLESEIGVVSDIKEVDLT